MGVLQAELVDRGGVDRLGEVQVGLGRGLLVGVVVQVPWVAAAAVDRAHHVVRDAIEAGGQGVHPEGEGVVEPSCEDRLVDLDVGAAGIGERPDLGVHSHPQIGHEGRPVAVVAVDRAVADRQRARDGDLHRMVGGGLCGLPVVDQERIAGRHPARDGGQGGRQHTSHRRLGSVLEVEPAEVATVVVDVVLASHLAIGDHVDTRLHLVGDDLGGGPHERRLGVSAGCLHLVRPASCVVAVR